ncbi:isocitrate lyase/phosphoenolpyruvate mutase family protein [Acidovorax temperans]|uniref:isocitrate lyase/phosphoenolpyruvate mutase family protein n=1 Tax=Acidovorax temperans TaxID=80878 RepID=UPI0035B43636
MYTNSKSQKLLNLFMKDKSQFLMGIHDALSARLAQDCGFQGLWASGLGLSAVSGMRDANELSWTQVMERVELIADTVSIPILVDIDTGYGDFNNVRLVMRRLARANVGGACIEDKLFPKTNSFVGEGQSLAQVDEFCGRIKAAKDTVGSNVMLVARCEALISGLSMDEALARCDHYVSAGADAVLIHSKKKDHKEIADFLKIWNKRAPVAIVPTTYSRLEAGAYDQMGASVVIWANQSMRAAIKGMEEITAGLLRDCSMSNWEDRIAPLARVFDLNNNHELEEAKKRYANF